MDALAPHVWMVKLLSNLQNYEAQDYDDYEGNPEPGDSSDSEEATFDDLLWLRCPKILLVGS